MISRIATIAAIAMTATAGGQATLNDPKAPENTVVTSGNARFTVLTPEMIRIEYSDNGTFEDRATFTVVNRKMDSVPAFRVRDNEDYLYITTDRLNLKYKKGSDPRTLPASADNLSITFDMNGQPVLWYPGLSDTLNLKGTCRTLDGSNGDNKLAEMEQGILSRSGWAVIDDSWSAERADGGHSFSMEYNPDMKMDWWSERKDPEAMDLYFLGYGHDYKKALSDYTKLAGKIPLPPDYVFGYWYSKYSVYSADDYRTIMSDIESNGIPADVMILDMDWHWNKDNGRSGDKGGWTGWSWNTNLIPDPQGLLKEMHDKGFKVSMNLHPADGVNSHESPVFFNEMNADLGGRYLNENKDNISWSLDYPDFTKSFFNRIMHAHEKTGADFWWIDWQQHLTSPYTPGLSQTFWINHVFFNEMKGNRTDRRPVIFHRWGGLGSHRYQIGFSGDALINFPTLAFQPYFTATASNVGYGYWGHDLGGHAFTDENTVNDPDLLLRWIQFGVFTPIFRTHATNDSRIERRIWKYPNFPDMLEAVRLRYALFPYIYTMARKTYDTGVSICRPLYYEYPETEEAYRFKGEYFFGDDILVAPVTEASTDGISKKEIWFPEGNWWSAATDELIAGPCVRTMSFKQNQIPYFFRQGSIITYNPATVRSVTERPDHLILNVVCGSDGKASLYEDSGDSNDYDTRFASTSLRQTCRGKKTSLTISPRTGDAEGLQPARSYTINIYNSPKPASVSVDGKRLAAKSFSYSARRHCTTIEIPKTPCSEATDIEITFTSNPR